MSAHSTVHGCTSPTNAQERIPYRCFNSIGRSTMNDSAAADCVGFSLPAADLTRDGEARRDGIAGLLGWRGRRRIGRGRLNIVDTIFVDLEQIQLTDRYAAAFGHPGRGLHRAVEVEVRLGSDQVLRDDPCPRGEPERMARAWSVAAAPPQRRRRSARTYRRCGFSRSITDASAAKDARVRSLSP